jgi:hypothetical protein
LLDAWAIENHGRKTYIWSAESTAFRREPTMHSHSIGPWTHDHVFLGSRHHQHERRAWFVVGLTTVMMVGEISVGWLSGSMALLADGSHMATHAAALGIAALAYLFARRQSGNARFTFGTGKFGDLAAFSSAIILAMIAIQIAYESVVRLAHPVPIAYGEAIAVAVLGLGVNLVSAWLLRAITAITTATITPTGTRTMQLTLRPFAKRSREPTCGLCQQRRSSSRAA